MPVGTAAGYPQLSGGVIPSSVRAVSILENFYLSTVYGAIANTNYQGQIDDVGDKIEIVGEPDMIVRPYVKGQSLEIDALEPPVQYMHIDQADYTAFKIDSIDKFQSDHDYMANWTKVAGQRMKIAVDARVLSTVYAQASATNSGTTAGKTSADINLGAPGAPLALTEGNVLGWIADQGLVLDEGVAPEGDRHLVLPPWICRLIKTSEFKDSSLAGDNTSILRNGRLGIIDRFTIYSSNNVAFADDGGSKAFEVIANDRSSLSFAMNVIDEEFLDLGTQGFGKFAKILYAYGFKVTKPDGIAHSHVYKG